MGKFITMNYSGLYVIEPKRPTGKDDAGNQTYSPEIAIRPVKMGVDAAGKVIGLFDTDLMLSEDQKEAAEKLYGKDWKEKLDNKIQNGPCNMRLLKPGEEIEVNGIPIEALNPSDAKRLPKTKSRRATVIQGPITAAAIGGGLAAAKVVNKVENKLLPAKTEKVKE